MDPLPLGRCSHKNISSTSVQCSRWASLVCSHCHQGICLEHHKIHQHEIQTRTDQLNNQINDLRQTLHTLTDQQMMNNLQEKLDQWSKKCKSDIDLKHAYMSIQVTNAIKQLDIEQFRSIQLKNIDQYIGQPLTDLLRSPDDIPMKRVELLEQQLEQIQEMILFLRITEDGQLKINQSITSIHDYSSLPLVSKHSMTDCPGAMAGSSLSHDYLLIFQTKPYFSLVLIEDDQSIRRTPIDYFVHDICWSQSTQVFLVATEHYLYEFDPLTNRLSSPRGDSKSTQTFWSLACHSADLYIIHKPDLIMSQRDVNKPYEKRKEWRKHEMMCEKGDQTIGCVRFDEHKQILGFSIKQSDNRWRVDLFSIDHLQRLHCGAAFDISSDCCMMTPLLNHHHQWLVQNYETILLDRNGQIIDRMDRNGYSVTLIGRDKLAFLDHLAVHIYRR